ncbi:MAG: hypothetical protein EP332_03255 [Bacteroidetes bacterium]|nr:MAG: hypothetical protein EP332_03255 [Bacteroidota bacterium]
MFLIHNLPTLKEPMILFEHIPKTAGSTLNWILSQNYTNRFFINQNLNPLDSLAGLAESPINPDQVELIHGHAAYLFDKYPNTKRITMLREPVSQMLSQFAFIREQSNHVSHQDVKNMTQIRDYIEYAKEKKHTNLQTRILAQSNSWITNEPDSFDLEPKGQEAMLSKALERMASFDFVLLTEEFDASVLLLAHQLSWRKTPYYYRLNPTKKSIKKSTLSEDELELIKETQAIDIKLHQAAVQRFNNDKLNYLNQFDIDQFKLRNDQKQAFGFLGMRLKYKLKHLLLGK